MMIDRPFYSGKVESLLVYIRPLNFSDPYEISKIYKADGDGMNTRLRKNFAIILSLIMTFGHFGPVVAQVHKVSGAVQEMPISQVPSHDRMSMDQLASTDASSEKLNCRSGNLVICDHCVTGCIGVLSEYSAVARNEISMFDTPIPPYPHTPILVFSFIRPPDTYL